MEISLDTDALRTVTRAQRALLAPLHHERLESWQQEVLQRIQEVVGADHTGIVFHETGGRPHVFTHDTDEAVIEGFQQQFAGRQSSKPRYKDDFLNQCCDALSRHDGYAFHERDFFDRSLVERSPYYQEVCHPAGLRRIMGLTLTSLGAVLITAFERSDREGFSDAGLQRLQLLAPAFEAGIRNWVELSSRRSRLVSMLDELNEAVQLHTAEGELLHRNKALQALLSDEPQAEQLETEVGELARTLCRSFQRGAEAVDAVAAPAARTVSLSTGEYRIRGSYLPAELLDREGVLVTVERRSPFPLPAVLRRRYDLSPREVEVSYLLAQGQSNTDIADRLSISPHTARHHTESVLRKLDLQARSGVAYKLLQTT